MKDKYCGYITFRMSDTANDCIITLGTAAFRNEIKLQRNWGLIEGATGYTTFVADLVDATGRTLLDKSIDYSTITDFLGKPLVNLISDARASL